MLLNDFIAGTKNKQIASCIGSLSLILTFVLLFSCHPKNNSNQAIENPVNHTIDTSEILTLIDKAKLFNNVQPDSIVYYAETALALSNKIQYSKGMALANYYLGNAEWLKDNYLEAISFHKKALSFTNDNTIKAIALRDLSLSLIYIDRIQEASDYLEQSIQILKELNDKKGLTLAYINQGIIESKKYNYIEALSSYHLALNLAEELNSSVDQSIILNNIGIIQQELEMDLLASDNFHKAFEITKETDQANLKALYINNIAFISIELGNYEEALDYIEEGLKITEASGDRRSTIFLYTNKGSAFLRLNEYSKAIENFNKSLMLSAEIGVKDHITTAQIGLGETYFQLQIYQNALLHLNIALDLAKINNDKKVIKDACRLLGETYQAMGAPTKAFEYMKLSNEIADSLSKSIVVKQFTQMEMQYDFDKKQHAIRLEQQKLNFENKRKLDRQRFYLTFSLSGFVLISLFVIIILRNNRYKQKINLQLAQNLNKIKEQKQEIEDNNKVLKSLNETKDTLFSIIAHDLISPFNIILGFTEQLSHNYNEMTEEKRKHYVDEIHNSSVRTFALLKDLLTWTRSQSGTIEINQEEFLLFDFINNSIDPYLNNASKKKISVINDIPETIYLMLDKYTMQTVFTNLFVNAIKFTHPGGKIQFWCKQHKGYLDINITDNGIGIPIERIDKLFKPGNHFSTKGTNNEIGTGLGLVICKDFVSMNGGQISVKSKAGEGSTFTVTLSLKISPRTKIPLID